MNTTSRNFTDAIKIRIPAFCNLSRAILWLWGLFMAIEPFFFFFFTIMSRFYLQTLRQWLGMIGLWLKNDGQGLLKIDILTCFSLFIFCFPQLFYYIINFSSFFLTTPGVVWVNNCVANPLTHRKIAV